MKWPLTFQCFQVETLRLTYDGIYDDSIMGAVAKLAQLKELTFCSKSDCSDVTICGFFDVFSRCANLKSLKLKIPISIVDVEQEALFEAQDWSKLHQPNLRYLLPGDGKLLQTKAIRAMMRRSSGLKCCLQDNKLFVKSDTTCGDIFKGFEMSDLSRIGLNKVVMC